MAAAGVTDGGDLASSLVMSAQDDGIATPSGQVNGYASTPAPKRFVQIANAGHLVFSDLCYIGASEGGLLAIAEKYGVTGASTLAPLASNGCPWQPDAGYTPITPQEGMGGRQLRDVRRLRGDAPLRLHDDGADCRDRDHRAECGQLPAGALVTRARNPHLKEDNLHEKAPVL